jgi:hypothetical protein
MLGLPDDLAELIEHLAWRPEMVGDDGVDIVLLELAESYGDRTPSWLTAFRLAVRGERSPYPRRISG